MLIKNLKGASQVFKQGLKIIGQNPSLLVYPYIAGLFTSITYSIIGASIIHNWYDKVFTSVNDLAPHHFRNILGIVTFSFFYASLIGAYFTCATSADVLAKLEGRKRPFFYGLVLVGKHFFRVTRFAILSIFLFPMGIWAQRRKLPRRIVGIVGSSFTLHMAQMAPAILSTSKPMGETVRDSINTLGKFWHEGIILKIGMYASIFLFVAAPKLIQHGFYHTHTASNIGWLISLELATSSLAVFKVINAIFTTTLYHKAKQKMLD